MENITFRGNNIQEFFIVYKTDDHAEEYGRLADSLSAWFAAQCGIAPKVVPDIQTEVPFEIILGDACRRETTRFYRGGDALDSMEYGIAVEGNKIVIAGAALFSTEQAVEVFKGLVTKNGGKLENVSVPKASLQSEFLKCETEYRLMQYNILAGLPGYGRGIIVEDETYRKEMITSIVRGYAPDVAVLNEFYDMWVPALLPMLKADYGHASLRREDGATNYNLLLYKAERFELVDSGYADIAVAINKHKRVLVWAVLKERKTGELILLFGSHLDHHGHGTIKQRKEQVGKLKEAMDAVRSKYNGLVVFMGDMNTKPGETIYNELREQTGLTNAMEGRGGEIDCCFLNDRAVVVNTYIDQLHYTEVSSDHKPIIIDVDLK